MGAVPPENVGSRGGRITIAAADILPAEDVGRLLQRVEPAAWVVNGNARTNVKTSALLIVEDLRG